MHSGTAGTLLWKYLLRSDSVPLGVAFYFAVVTFTTIGYGAPTARTVQLAPLATASRALCCGGRAARCAPRATRTRAHAGDVTPSTAAGKVFFMVYVIGTLVVHLTVLTNFVDAAVRMAVKDADEAAQAVPGLGPPGAHHTVRCRSHCTGMTGGQALRVLMRLSLSQSRAAGVGLTCSTPSMPRGSVRLAATPLAAPQLRLWPSKRDARNRRCAPHDVRMVPKPRASDTVCRRFRSA